MTNVSNQIEAAAFFLADHAAVENGKLYTQGAFWNRLNFPAFPVAAHFGVAAVLNVPWATYHEQHRFAIWFEDADGNRLSGEIGGEFSVGAAPDMKRGDETIMPIAVMVNNFPINAAGDYSAVLTVDTRELSRWSFRAVQHPS